MFLTPTQNHENLLCSQNCFTWTNLLPYICMVHNGIPGVPKRMTRLYNVISSKTLNLTSSNFLHLFSMGWNSVLKDLMGLPPSIEILLMFENQQILSPVIIPKITSKIVLNITTCKRIFWKDSLNAKTSFHLKIQLTPS